MLDLHIQASSKKTQLFLLTNELIELYFVQGTAHVDGKVRGQLPPPMRKCTNTPNKIPHSGLGVLIFVGFRIMWKNYPITRHSLEDQEHTC